MATSEEEVRVFVASVSPEKSDGTHLSVGKRFCEMSTGGEYQLPDVQSPLLNAFVAPKKTPIV